MLELIKKHKLIVIIRNVDKDDIIPLCEALYDGGVRLAEITFSQKQSRDEETAQSIMLAAKHFLGRMSIGAGTVLTERQVELTYAAGGKFIISPNTNEAVIKKTKELGLTSLPGALTPTEIVTAYSYGADLVKIFPAGDLGSKYINAIKAPLSGIPLLAVGGVDLHNLPDFLDSGVYGVGIGSNIIQKDFIKRKDFSSIIRLAHEYVSLLEAHSIKD